MTTRRKTVATKQTAFRLTEEDIALLDALREFWGVRSRTATLCLLLRQPLYKTTLREMANAGKS